MRHVSRETYLSVWYPYDDLYPALYLVAFARHRDARLSYKRDRLIYQIVEYADVLEHDFSRRALTAGRVGFGEQSFYVRFCRRDIQLMGVYVVDYPQALFESILSSARAWRSVRL